MARRWQFLESNNRVFCNGRCITGHNLTVFILALVLIILTSSLFFVFDCPYLIEHLSPLVPILPAILFLFCLLCLLRTAFTDPGIIPRPNSDEILLLEANDSVQDKSVSGRMIELQMKTGHILQLKYCQTCKMYRPPRVSHCSLCNACIANFDHHCPWVGNCIGLRNYRYFYIFLFSLSILCVYIFIFDIVHIVLLSQKMATVADAIRTTPATMVEGIICFFSIWSVVGLWGYHTYLICRSVTTNEDIKETWNTPTEGMTVLNPFSRQNGCLNCFATLCGPLPPSFLNLRSFVQKNDNILHINGVWNTSLDQKSTQQKRFVPRDLV